MQPHVTIQLARTREEFEGAYRLLAHTRIRWGAEADAGNDFWLLKQHALPATNTIVALSEGKVVGAICLFGESPFHLPVESHLDLKAFRRNLDGRLAELSLPGIAPGADSPELLHALYHYAICFGSSYCHYDGFITEAPLGWAKEYANSLHFQKIYEPMKERQILYLDARNEAVDYREAIPKNFAEFRFPEKKFFLVAHQTLQPDVMNYLFNVLTRVFATLNDQDLRILKNVYDWGEYAKLLPDRKLQMPAKQTPRYPRFPMNCEGYIVTEDGTREHLQLVDVSREGLKVRLGQTPESTGAYVLMLFVGVNKKTELIARTVWVDEKAGMAGFEVRSCDSGWTQLIDYLEKDFLRVA